MSKGIKVLALVGESGSGKSAISFELGKQGYNVIRSYTTREPRYEGETEYIFSTIEDYKRDFTAGKVVEDTLFGGNAYWSTIDQFREGWNVIVVNAQGINAYYQDERFKTIGIYIKTELVNRYTRIRQQGALMDVVAVNRIQRDKDNFNLIKCNYVIDNNGSMKDTVSIIQGIMEENNLKNL